MGFPQNVLAKDEKVEASLHPHWLTVFVPCLVGLLLVAGAVWVSVATPDDTTGNWIQWISLAAMALLAIPLVVVPLLRWRTTHYVVTSHRVMVRRGILHKSGKDITLSKITDVSFEQSLLDRMINAGSLRIESAGESPDETLRNIPNSNHVQQLINRLVDDDDTRRRAVAMGRAAHGRDGYEDIEPDPYEPDPYEPGTAGGEQPWAGSGRATPEDGSRGPRNSSNPSNSRDPRDPGADPTGASRW